MKPELPGRRATSFAHSSHREGGVADMPQRCFLGPGFGNSPLSRARAIALVNDMCSVYVFDAVSKPTPVARTTPLPPERSGEEDDMLLRITAGHCWVVFKMILDGGHGKQR